MNTEQAFKHWRTRILLTIWVTYSTFYLCRVNMSIAVPSIMGEFGYSKTAMGGVMTALLVAYAAGQFINGQLRGQIRWQKVYHSWRDSLGSLVYQQAVSGSGYTLRKGGFA